MPTLTPKKDFKVFFAIMATLILPTAIALLTVVHPREYKSLVENPTPFGYTWSLLLFIIPILAIGTWLHIHPDEKLLRKSFWLAIGVLIPTGFLLDFFLGNAFFNFHNPQATLQIYLPGFDFKTDGWIKDLPIEEFVFYASGFTAVLLIYVWCDEYWFDAYNVPDYGVECRKINRIIVFHRGSLILGIAIVVFAVIYKKWLAPPEYRAGFPGYFTFLTAVSFVPSAAFFETTNPFINWRAFSFTFFFVLLISLLWEATLAIPYEWWGYNYDQMMGLTIGAWSELPIEAALLWMAVTFTTVIVYEVIKIWIHSGKKAWPAFWGTGKSEKG